MNALHPTAVLCLWASAAVFIQTLPGVWSWLGALLVALVAFATARTRFSRLARRIRVLCVVTLVLFVFATPGVRIFPSVTWLSATWDGLGLGLEHGGRLVAMVALVALLLERLSAEQLIHGIHHALRGLVAWGLPADRIAVRLSLVLGAMARTESGWRAWMLEAEASGPSGVVAIPVHPLSRIDGACIIGALGFIIGWGFV